MPAFQTYLSPELERAVLAGVLSIKEAWELQDVWLTSLQPDPPVPEHLWPALDKLDFFELELTDRATRTDADGGCACAGCYHSGR